MTSVGESIETRVGLTGVDEYWFWGHRVFSELLGRTTTGQMLACGITGRILAAEEAGVIDDIVTAMTSADARLWSFKLARVAASHGSPMYGVAATLVMSHRTHFGAHGFQAVAEGLVDLHRQDALGELGDDALATAIAQGAPGFGMLYSPMDPRFDALLDQAAKRGRGDLPFVSLCRRAGRIGRAQRIEPQAFAAVCALCLDLQMTPYQAGLIGMLALIHVSLAHASEGAHQQSPALKQLADEYVKYVGPAARTSPRARTSSTEESG